MVVRVYQAGQDHMGAGVERHRRRHRRLSSGNQLGNDAVADDDSACCAVGQDRERVPDPQYIPRICHAAILAPKS
jgi:hypothetical protein